MTASGGAWNASIVAEYFHFKRHIYTTTGLGATIRQASDGGNFDLLLAGTIMMAATSEPHCSFFVILGVLRGSSSYFIKI